MTSEHPDTLLLLTLEARRENFVRFGKSGSPKRNRPQAVLIAGESEGQDKTSITVGSAEFRRFDFPGRTSRNSLTVNTTIDESPGAVCRKVATCVPVNHSSTVRLNAKHAITDLTSNQRSCGGGNSWH